MLPVARVHRGFPIERRQYAVQADTLRPLWHRRGPPIGVEGQGYHAVQTWQPNSTHQVLQEDAFYWNKNNLVLRWIFDGLNRAKMTRFLAFLLHRFYHKSCHVVRGEKCLDRAFARPRQRHERRVDRYCLDGHYQNRHLLLALHPTARWTKVVYLLRSLHHDQKSSL